MRILVVEDDPSVAQILKILLVSHNYAVETATDGEMGLNLAEAFDYDLILLDILLPKLDGISLCKELRAKGYKMPILLLTGQGGSYEKVAGLDTGADDYVVKPFDHQELIARIRALLRRGQISSQPVLEWGDLRLDPGSHEAAYSNSSLALTPKEYGLVEMFLRSPRLTFSLGMILEHLWTFEEAPSEDAVRVHMKTLRQKLKAAGAPIDFIETVYGIGYRLNPARAILPTIQPAANLEEQPPEKTLKEKKAKDPPRVMMVGQDASGRSLFGQSTVAQLLHRQEWSIVRLEPPQNSKEKSLKEMLTRCLPNLLILEINPPRFEELALCQSVRQDDRWAALPILLITPQADTALVHRIFAAGASDFISQPIAGPELIARIEIHLEKASLLQKISILESQTSSAPLQQTPPAEKQLDPLNWTTSDRAYLNR